MTVRVGLLVFEGVDLLDVGGPYEVLLTANRLSERDGQDPPFEVVPVAAEAGTYRAYGGLRLEVTTTIAQAAPLDVFVVPGLIDVDAATSDPRLMAAIRDGAGRTDLLTSVCTGAILLAEAGLLAGRVATTHFEDVDVLEARIGAGQARRARWVDADSVVTSGGLSSGIAMALHLVERLHSRELAVRTARQLEYDWDPDDGVIAAVTPGR